MKNEEAITCIKMMFAFWANSHKLNVAQMEAAKDLAIAALGNGGFIETSKMVPLTLEQLRGMDGKPVWVHVIDHTVFADKEDDFDGWGMCRKSWVRVWDNKREDIVHIDYHFEDYGKTWLAYAYPPVHIDREAWTAEWKEYTGADAGFHYCSKCGQQAFNYEDGGEVVEVLSDFCPSCGRPTTPKGLDELKRRLRGVR